ncbi:hypothetical protein GCM10022403_089880 [Streptomyces coacervatus]|uniref:Secreted protein n=1 Tax=Streptomyces coacervatus TaxID=647381 RepID=A0ABP7JGQ1_9ACTN|nr:hypothetical protein [Streptomyces coacervatus]MDF2271170.1 hypothetical protein [Streptomyces coacervatus]
MFSRKKIAAVSGLLCSLAVTCTGITQAYAAAGPGGCTVAASGDVTCIQGFAGKTADGDDYIVRRANTCTPQTPMELPVIPLLNSGSTKIGPQVTCSPNDPGPQDNDHPSELPGGLFG